MFILYIYKQLLRYITTPMAKSIHQSLSFNNVSSPCVSWFFCPFFSLILFSDRVFNIYLQCRHRIPLVNFCIYFQIFFHSCSNFRWPVLLYMLARRNCQYRKNSMLFCVVMSRFNHSVQIFCGNMYCKYSPEHSPNCVPPTCIQTCLQ